MPNCLSSLVFQDGDVSTVVLSNQFAFHLFIFGWFFLELFGWFPQTHSFLRGVCLLLLSLLLHYS